MSDSLSPLAETGIKFSALKPKDKEQVIEWMYEEMKGFYSLNYSFPEELDLKELAERVRRRAKAKRINLDSDEIFRQMRKRQSSLSKRVKEEVRLKLSKKREIVSLTNLCLIEDGKGNIVAMEKKSGHDAGITLPGGHREKNETFYDSVVREVKEETGLDISGPELIGVYHWERTEVHHIILLYRASRFTGKLRSSKEGKVYWFPLEDFRNSKNLSLGIRAVLSIILDGKGRECYKQFGEFEREFIY